VLQDGKYGYLVPMHDQAALAAGMQSALDQPIAREILAEAVAPFAEKVVLARHFAVLGLGDAVPGVTQR